MKLFLSRKQKHSAKKTDFRAPEGSYTPFSLGSNQKQRTFFIGILSASFLLTSFSAVRALESNTKPAPSDASPTSHAPFAESGLDTKSETGSDATTEAQTSNDTSSQSGSASTSNTYSSDISVTSDQNATVIIDGQEQPLNSDGELRKTITHEDGYTSIDISTGGKNSNSKSEIHIESNSNVYSYDSDAEAEEDKPRDRAARGR